ncbi:TIGR02269 family lipoprotein [Pyxidicoccus parkwayensis]|nr:TIGR02269 family lipoprotein [Pyxidicoccus parkwaysis]
MSLLTTGCASLPRATSRGGTLADMARAPQPGLAQPSREERQETWMASPPSIAGTAARERMVRRVGPRDDTTRVAAGGEAGAVQPSAARVREAVLEAVDEVKDSTNSAASALSGMARRPPSSLSNRGLSGVNGVFTRYLDFGSNQLPWLRSALGSTTTLVAAAGEVGDADMEFGILRLAGPRLQSAMFGSMLLAAWIDFLQLADVVLRECPAYSVEALFMDMHRVQQRMAPVLTALESGDAEQVEGAATSMPELMGELTREFGSIRDGARTSMEKAGRTLAVVQWVEMLTLISTMKMSLPRQPPAVPATLGVGLVMGPGGVMAGSQLVVSAEWVEMIRRLVKAGVLSLPAVSAAVRIHGGQVMMAQSNDDLPEGVREALGDSPEVRGMRVTGRAGAGMSENPLHHVMPQERRTWFEGRGFTGEMDIDRFCVRLEQAHHEAIHGGGNWRLGRMWPGEWNRMIMRVLGNAENDAGRMLTRNEILNIVAENMRFYDIPMRFVTGGRR